MGQKVERGDVFGLNLVCGLERLLQVPKLQMAIRDLEGKLTAVLKKLQGVAILVVVNERRYFRFQGHFVLRVLF